MKAKLFFVFVGMAAGNCIAESFHAEPDFIKVAEVSFYEGWALLTYWFCDTFLLKD